MDSNGVRVQSELPAPCKCAVFTPTALSVCPPLGYGGCEGGRCEETGSAVFVMAFGGCVPQVSFPSWVVDLTSCLARCKELEERCRKDAETLRDIGFEECEASYNQCLSTCSSAQDPVACQYACKANYHLCRAGVLQRYRNALRQCETAYDKCRDDCYKLFPPKKDSTTLSN